MRVIDEVIIHCTATPSDMDVTVDHLYQWHVEDNGWSDIGYHALISLDGTVWYCRPLERSGAHCTSRNATTIGIAFAGGYNKDGSPWQPNEEQIEAYKHYEEELFSEFGKLPVNPHNKYSNKTCPNFNISILSRD